MSSIGFLYYPDPLFWQGIICSFAIWPPCSPHYVSYLQKIRTQGLVEKSFNIDFVIFYHTAFFGPTLVVGC